MKFITLVLYTKPKSKVKSLTHIQVITGYFLWYFWLVFLSRHYAHSFVIQMHIQHITDKGISGNVSNLEFVEWSVFQAAYDFVRSCLSNYIIKTHQVVVEKTGRQWRTCWAHQAYHSSNDLWKLGLTSLICGPVVRIYYLLVKNTNSPLTQILNPPLWRYPTIWPPSDRPAHWLY